ncbi:MAG: DUF2184 domain-containing protein [Desulfovibrio sp.]|jgi:hypothetical protein|nr:DUF2184 domain-containing protein [Desulfovibrio sp.]
MFHSTPVTLRLKPGQVRPFSMDGAAAEDLALLGVQIPPSQARILREIYSGAFSMDAGTGPQSVTAASVGTPIQFLQTLLPGAVRAVTAARKIDKLAGRSIAGNWHDEDIIRTVVELSGQPRPYGDYAPGPLTSFNIDFERRSVVRFEQDMEVLILEEERAAAVRQNSGELKRAAVAQSLAVELNRIGFYGYNDGACRTYGFLNDPSLPNYVTVPAGDGGETEWASKTFQEIVEDLLLAASTLRARSREVIDPEENACTLALSTSAREYLNVVNEHGISVKQWLRDTYPKWRIESAPELDGANGGANVFYLFADEVPGGGEGGSQKTVEQYVQAALRLLGVEKRAKGSYEAYSSATAGIMWQAPFAVVRYTGI